MPVAVIVVSMLVVLVVTTPSEASPSCMSKIEARQRFGSVHIYWHGPNHCWDATPGHRRARVQNVQRRLRADQSKREGEIRQALRGIDRPKWQDSMSEMLPDDESGRAPWATRWVSIEPSPLVARWVDIVQVKPPPRFEREPEPFVSLRVMWTVLIAIVLAIALVAIAMSVRNKVRHQIVMRSG
jgi:hypothetical protein